ncbi:spore germination protein [Clostridium ganghwense]|uniref:Spore germination protein n=1 Tax=Clostridium ganghwense TaxID=312089 RepID=A0ABT4CPN0_9CLOT|nr:spore germination protein [Clostridium ganghwense]MCY6371017.1 spore germination protein [Clostridium ganghwense]
MVNNNIEEKINFILNEVGLKNPLVVKKFFIGKKNPLLASLIYIDDLTNKTIINRDILTPLMFKIEEELLIEKATIDYICRKYIPMSNTIIKTDLNTAVDSIKIGKTVILIDGLEDFIITDTVGGEHRSISDPLNESAIRGSREGFVENVKTNISILRRKIKDQNLSQETYKIGRRSQTDLVLLYIDDIVDKDVLEEVRSRIKAIDIDSINDTGMLGQYIEDHPYSPFPQVYGTERPDIVKANLMEGKIAFLLNGTPHVITAPATFVEFFQGVEDYHERTLVSSFSRILRLLSVLIIITLSPIYLTLINYNVELIPIKFITPIIESRKGIALPPFLEILSMEVVVEFLREGGLRLPPKVAGTLSIVGGIIIGNTAVDSKVVSPTTLLVVGISVVSTFLIPNYEMSLSIRFLRFPMLVLANAMGFLGLAAGLFFLLILLSYMKSFGISYFSIKSSDLKDIFIRAPLWYMNKTPEAVPSNNPVRQTDFRKKLWRKRKKNE